MKPIIVEVKTDEEEQIIFRDTTNNCLDVWIKSIIKTYLSLEDLIRIYNNVSETGKILKKVGLESKIINYSNATFFIMLKNKKILDFKLILYPYAEC